MNQQRTWRLKNIIIALISLSIATGLILYALSENINLFYTPAELKVAKLNPMQRLRVGGMVVQGSLERFEALNVKFKITDFKESLTIAYTGILPDLFKEGTGVVIDGYLEKDIFIATQVLAKHDENYMPPQVQSALEPNLSKKPNE